MSRIEQFIRRLTFPYQTKLTSNLRLQHLSIIQEISDLYLFGGVDLFFLKRSILLTNSQGHTRHIDETISYQFQKRLFKPTLLVPV